jgi:hypothetical protein
MHDISTGECRIIENEQNENVLSCPSHKFLAQVRARIAKFHLKSSSEVMVKIYLKAFFEV